jgi:hypothetical protein
MSIHRSYFSKNDTILYDNYVNTGRNPVTQLYFGSSPTSFAPLSFSRFIFDLDLSELIAKVNDGTISTECHTGMTHTLTMTNSSSFDLELLNGLTSEGTRRATSFDLILFRIPKTSGSTGNDQYWDEGVGYDYANLVTNTPTGSATSTQFYGDKSFSDRPANWFQATTLNLWSEEGIYDNQNTGNVNYNDLVIIDRKHFEFGNEDIDFDMTDEINNILDGSLTGVTGWGIAYVPDIENISGLTEQYSVGFFTRHTQTFYEPYLLTDYNDLIQDDRNLFVSNKTNKLYLYVYQNGNPLNLDSNPTVDIADSDGVLLSGHTGLTTCLITKGVYEVSVPPISGYTKPCQFTDTWKGIEIDGVAIDDIINEFVLYNYSKEFTIGSVSREPSLYGFESYGIKQNEKILNTDIRRVGVIIKKAYTGAEVLNKVDAQYRIYVKEGTTEVQVQDWTQINRTPNEYFFIFDTRDKIPNEYFVDIKVTSSGEVDTYKKVLQFQIVNKK